jgi:ubiquitin-conjugating enzyme (huntingtin interacting protein 2)
MATETRLKKELHDVSGPIEKSPAGVCANPVDDKNLRVLRGSIRGPSDTPYDGGVFHVDITIPPSYPFEPPKMKFATKIWHPNVSSQTGAICLDILKDQWSPALTIKTALLSLQALLSTPEPNDPQDAEVAKMYLGNRAEFDRMAKYWTETYATVKGEDEKVAKLAQMGFPEDAVRKALAKANGDESAALEALLGG